MKNYKAWIMLAGVLVACGGGGGVDVAGGDTGAADQCQIEVQSADPDTPTIGIDLTGKGTW